MKMRFVSMMVAACSMLAFVACKDGTGAGGGGTGGTGGSGNAGGTGGSGNSAGSGGTGGTSISCADCACTYKSGDVDPGCADTCDNTISGAANPNFCNGSAALSQCEACIVMRCGLPSSACN